MIVAITVGSQHVRIRFPEFDVNAAGFWTLSLLQNREQKKLFKLTETSVTLSFGLITFAPIENSQEGRQPDRDNLHF
jgi:hypothetical protein